MSINRHSFQDRDTLVEDLLKMFEQGSLNNVTIKLRDGQIDANKDILMARSDYFATMFRNDNFIEGKNCSVDMSHCSYAVMEKIVKFLDVVLELFGEFAIERAVRLTDFDNRDLRYLREGEFQFLPFFQ